MHICIYISIYIYIYIDICVRVAVTEAKSNISHLESAAGVAGLLKCLVAYPLPAATGVCEQNISSGKEYKLEH